MVTYFTIGWNFTPKSLHVRAMLWTDTLFFCLEKCVNVKYFFHIISLYPVFLSGKHQGAESTAVLIENLLFIILYMKLMRRSSDVLYLINFSAAEVYPCYTAVRVYLCMILLMITSTLISK